MMGQLRLLLFEGNLFGNGEGWQEHEAHQKHPLIETNSRHLMKIREDRDLIVFSSDYFFIKVKKSCTCKMLIAFRKEASFGSNMRRAQ